MRAVAVRAVPRSDGCSDEGVTAVSPGGEIGGERRRWWWGKLVRSSARSTTWGVCGDKTNTFISRSNSS